MIVTPIPNIRDLPATAPGGGKITYQAYTGTIDRCQAEAAKLTWIAYVQVAFYHTARKVLYVPVAQEFDHVD